MSQYCHCESSMHGKTYMYECGCDDDSRAKVLGDEETPLGHIEALSPLGEHRKPGAQYGSEQDDEDR